MGSSITEVQAGGPPAPRRIAILGFAESVHDAPFSDPSWEMWGMNGLWRVLSKVPEERFAAWFEVHPWDYILEHEKLSNIGTQQSDWLKKSHPFPVFMQEKRADCPSAEFFNVEAMVARFGRDYFTSSVAFELGFALLQPNVAEIGLWGIDLVHGTEWGDQRPCAEYWLGRFDERGVKITTHQTSALLKQQFRYAYDQAPPIVAEMRDFIQRQAVVTQNKIKELSEANAKAIAEMQSNDGVMQFLRVLNERLDIWGRGGTI